MESFKKTDQPDLTSTTINKLPDDVLIDIFSDLWLEDLCYCSQVCRRWHDLVRSLKLKKIVTKVHLSETQLCLLIDNHFHEDLESFMYLNSTYSSPVRQITFQKMRRRSPRLKKLILSKCSLSVMLSELPLTFRHLSLWYCEINPYELFRENGSNRLNITCLDLSGVSTFFTSEDINVLLCLKNLNSLYLQNCFRINSAGIESLIDILPQLKVLDVEGTDISNEGVQIIFGHAPGLKELYIGHTCTDDDLLLDICIVTLNLSVLCIKGTKITFEKLEGFFDKKVSILRSRNCLENTSQDLNITRSRHLDSCNHYLTHTCLD